MNVNRRSSEGECAIQYGLVTLRRSSRAYRLQTARDRPSEGVAARPHAVICPSQTNCTFALHRCTSRYVVPRYASVQNLTFTASTTQTFNQNLEAAIRVIIEAQVCALQSLRSCNKIVSLDSSVDPRQLPKTVQYPWSPSSAGY